MPPPISTESNSEPKLQPREFVFHGSAKKDLKDFPQEIMDEFATALTAVQHDQVPTMQFKHLNVSGGKSAIELARNGRPAFRVVYTTKKPGQVDVLYAGKKTTQGPCNKLMNAVEKRLKAI